jgi:DnaJ-class molecular chaperone
MTVDTFLIIGGLAAAYVVSLYLWPYRPCPRCDGKGTNRGSSRRRFGKCKRCDGTRSVQRTGSRQVHRAVRGAVRYRKEK